MSCSRNECLSKGKKKIPDIFFYVHQVVPVVLLSPLVFSLGLPAVIYWLVQLQTFLLVDSCYHSCAILTVAAKPSSIK